MTCSWKLVAAFGAVVLVASCRKAPPLELVAAAAGPRGAPGGPSPGSGGAPSNGSGGGSAFPWEPGSGGAPSSAMDGTAPPASGTGGGASSADAGPNAPAPPPPPPFTKAALLAAIADCTLAHAQDFEARATALRDASRAVVDAPSPEHQAAAREAWWAAMTSWDENELFRVGPAARKTEPAGQDLRDGIYSWPLVSRCRIEEQIVGEAYASADFATSLVNGRGLWAYEYLAFHGGADNACSRFSTINAGGTWNALGTAELARRKAAYAAAVASDVLSRAQALVRAWSPDGGNFRDELARAGAGSKTFTTEQDALNAVSDALFYVELEMKDLKLAVPLGISPECLDGLCPEALESQFAGASASHLRSNLAGVQQLFLGCDGGQGLGFDDWLVAVNAGDLAARMRAALEGAEASIRTLPGPLETLVTSDTPRVRAVYDALKAFTDLVKTELVTVLNLELPKTAEGDND